MTAFPLTLLAVAMAVISWMPSINHAFSSPAVLTFPSSSPLQTDADDRKLRWPPTMVLRSVPSARSAADEVEEFKADGRSLLDDNIQSGDEASENIRKSFLQRIFKRGGVRALPVIRGDKYGASNNSTILAPSDAAIKVGELHRFMMRILHRFDKCQPKDSKLALACLWWKALAGNDPTSSVYDYELSYDLLPTITRWFVCRRLCRLYPRLHHANVEIRTAYLDKSVSSVINTIMRDYTTNANITTPVTTPKKKIRLIVMGGGYDTRSMKLLETSLLKNGNTAHRELLEQKRQSQHKSGWRNILRSRKRFSPNKNAFDNITSNQYDLECYELDLPEVVHAKRKLLQSRLFHRRPWLKDGAANEYPKLISVNFNNLNDTQRALEKIIHGSLEKNDEDDLTVNSIDNIIVFEGVMIYLDEGIPHSLLELCSNVLNKQSNLGTTNEIVQGYLCFADRLENIPGGDEDAALIEMESTGWDLLDWLPKPGLARHMGVARLRCG
eukprot:CAMPEP_0181127684 /NCGR_PEP_ID=MMETSP1071-20121207/28332_1 /TAXON_ID=35127 /ORGANISM="Thalassiosira sp., Strain NH16" /LENGTH=497 /DNA_ID=CAMNT_0023213445 /DNA_START=122 /DNA_END=1615 /DNA_ORIENTATION=-